jgi:hypothetical protein
MKKTYASSGMGKDLATVHTTLTSKIREAKDKMSKTRYIKVKLTGSELSMDDSGSKDGTWTKDMDDAVKKLFTKTSPSYLVVFKDDRSILLITVSAPALLQHNIKECITMSFFRI